MKVKITTVNTREGTTKDGRKFRVADCICPSERGVEIFHIWLREGETVKSGDEVALFLTRAECSRTVAEMWCRFY